MASLDNFPSNHGPQPHYPTLAQRFRGIQHSIHSSQSRDWDLVNAVPVAPIQPLDSQLRAGAGAHPDPQITERLSHRSMKDYLVPTNPEVYALRGDTIDALHAVDTGAQSRSWLSNWWRSGGNRRARVRTYSRFHPYIS